MDIRIGDAFSGEFKTLIIQIIRRITAIKIIIMEIFLNLLSNLSNSSIFIKIRIRSIQIKFILNLIYLLKLEKKSLHSLIYVSFDLRRK